MVHLGIIRDAAQAPPGCHRVALRPGGDRSPEATVNSWSERRFFVHGPRRYELLLDVPEGSEVLETGAAKLAEVLTGLGWKAWWLDTDSLSAVVGLDTEEAVTEWGKRLLDHYRPPEATLLVAAGDGREAVMRAIRIWEDCFGHARYLPSCDFDAKDIELREKKQARVAKAKAAFRPKFFAR